MRITRSTLRRIIAEESARILAETKKGTHERVPGGHQMRMAAGFEDEPEEEDWDDDYYGDPDPFGDDEALEKGYEYDSATAGWKKPAEDETAEDDYYGDDDPFGDDEALEMGYEYDPSSAGWKKPGLDEGAERRDDTECLYILKRSGQHVYIVAPPYLESAAELDELGHDITDQIMSGGPAVRDANVYEFLGSNPQVAVVRVRGAYEMAEDYMMSLEDNLGATTGPVYESEEELDEDDALDEGDPSYRDPGDDAGYAAHLQRDLGAFTSPENIPGTMQYRDRERAAYYEKSGAPRNTSDYAEYDHLREDDEPLSEARWAKLAGVLKG